MLGGGGLNKWLLEVSDARHCTIKGAAGGLTGLGRPISHSAAGGQR